ncbi:hypothetical protein A3A79_03525 [Candidatus Gottesmanbacteria bacterium RIFCSPLOWO2_01_FULL_43_11b]|uniref:DUF948 domain-containing protein n=1 Tax=Candidatus Gottesmanbacteria bacterium RIFCSPLOWO2_01_FULL_43_11b TaxID=1798392 RepID=A0A1F6AHQ7_9BACT|nr:MAG: hypothetical protein A3A79_03525 [Candidatus Gottesmanbacteria bacterium RIFCSPLOWO2_01_FULL_43_11b]
MDPIQLLIIVVTLILTILLVVLGIQMWFILKEIRISIQKMNKMLDDMQKVTGTVGEGVSNLGGVMSGLKAGLSIFSSLRKKGEGDE